MRPLGWPDANVIGVLEERGIWTDKETPGVWAQGKVHEAMGEGGHLQTAGGLKGTGTGDILDVWPPAVREIEVCCLSHLLAGVCHGSPSKLTPSLHRDLSSICCSLLTFPLPRENSIQSKHCKFKFTSG